MSCEVLRELGARSCCEVFFVSEVPRGPGRIGVGVEGNLMERSAALPSVGHWLCCNTGYFDSLIIAVAAKQAPSSTVATLLDVAERGRAPWEHHATAPCQGLRPRANAHHCRAQATSDLKHRSMTASNHRPGGQDSCASPTSAVRSVLSSGCPLRPPLAPAKICVKGQLVYS